VVLLLAVEGTGVRDASHTRPCPVANVTRLADSCYCSGTPKGDVAVFHGAARADL